MDAPLRCPKCQALVVDRRFAQCTTCHADLPAEWLLTSVQLAELDENDRHARSEHSALMNELTRQDEVGPEGPLLNPNDLSPD